MPRTVRDIMWSESLSVLSRTDRVRQDVFRPTEGGWEPPIDVLETETGLLVVVALPGVRREEIEFGIAHGDLFVRGIRRWPTERRPARVHRIELPHGRFERRLPLPPGTYQLVGHDLTDGCLVLTLRRLA